MYDTDHFYTEGKGGGGAWIIKKKKLEQKKFTQPWTKKEKYDLIFTPLLTNVGFPKKKIQIIIIIIPDMKSKPLVSDVIAIFFSLAENGCV